MQREGLQLKETQLQEVCHGFQLLKKEYVEGKAADLYTLRHVKTGADLLFFDRADENKTFCISFKTLPEDHTGVFHILEHSVLNGSRKFPVKEPFVSMMQSSMQTYLNAMTFDDKTVYPVSSRNEQDFFQLMAVYLDAVFAPLIYDKPEILMQEGWHYEFDDEEKTPYYNGVVYSEMQGVYADVDGLIEDYTKCLLFPDTSYGYMSGGHPEHIPELTQEQFVATHKRFYHPSNAKIILDGHMDVDKVLAYIDEEYLSKYDRQEADFDFTLQEPKASEQTIYYEVQEGEPALAQLSMAKIFCFHSDVEKICGAKILADYLTGSNEAPLKRAFLDQGLAQDVNLTIGDGIYQPMFSLVFQNVDPVSFNQIKALVPEVAQRLAEEGLDRAALLASLEHLAFGDKEIVEPYGMELSLKILDGWLYGADPLSHVETGAIYDALREKLQTGYFEELLRALLADPTDKSWLYVLPSAEKGMEDVRQEAERLAQITGSWEEADWNAVYDALERMQQWQQSPDSEEALESLPHLDLTDIEREVPRIAKERQQIGETTVLHVQNETNGIVYLNLYFDISDFTLEEMRRMSVLTDCFGALGTKDYPADQLQTKIKEIFGHLSAKIKFASKQGELEQCKVYFVIAGGVLQENADQALELLQELLLHGRYDEVDRINEIILQTDYYLKQSLIGEGHNFAMDKALSAFSKEGAMKELLDGESFRLWFAELAKTFQEAGSAYCESFCELAARAFASNRLFAGYSGQLTSGQMNGFIQALPTSEIGLGEQMPEFDCSECKIEIPASVGFTAIGNNLYAAGSCFSGSCAVLSSLMSYGYLWGMVRVQGGAYGTGMGVIQSGDLFCYSYRDPNVANTKAVYAGMAEFLEAFLAQEQPLDDLIIGTVNATDPLLDPAGICNMECMRYLKGIDHEMINQVRQEILDTTPEDLKALLPVLAHCIETGKFCAIGDGEALAF